ncbi:hypothetical protein AB1L88_22525 [Tautonia sp. JC769]|uniref:hypothetical protein n=1 Tax=Tautonia sp. JC769 TaxID=3232135 RepID=UPI003459AD4F
MRVELASLLGMLLTFGCAEDPSSAPAPDRPATATAGQAGGSPDEPVRGDAEERETYTMKATTDSDPSLEVRVRCESEAASEAYRVQVFALVPDDSAEGVKKVQLGGQDIFKPLARGETASIFIDQVDRDAWIEAGGGRELNLSLEVEPAAPGREAPDVSLRIVEATPES